MEGREEMVRREAMGQDTIGMVAWIDLTLG